MAESTEDVFPEGRRQDLDLDELRAARQELDDVIDEIRRLDGFGDFLAEPSFDDISAAAGQQPLCYLSPAQGGGLALIVRGDEVTAVWLEDLSAEEVRRRVGGLAVSGAEFRANPDAGFAAWGTDLDGTARWLWDAAMGPLLHGELAGADHVTLIPAGLLGMLPLHAAWTPDASTPTGRRWALDHTTISYIPNARALTAARRIAQERGPDRLLVVADPDRPAGGGHTSFTALEAEAVAGVFPGAHRMLRGPRATVPAVLRELPAAGVVHFACHGFADIGSPLDSGLSLADGETLRLRDLMGLDLRVRLAVLSSCETSVPGTRLPDEVVALPTGLLQAGAAGVVASQWPVPDWPTTLVMTRFYDCWRAGSPPAEALRQAQIWVRDTSNEEKTRFVDTAADEGRLSPTSADALLDTLLLTEPDARDEAHISRWAAFAHFGI
ncbi:CHAT domain-containing protein [Streptomyces sp. T028]|uniref:CHAT domain-containing protein n=1 Tax=Streptomyces sp. T028 TaxID=3394379 RepID=UPI003A87DA55